MNVINMDKTESIIVADDQGNIKVRITYITIYVYSALQGQINLGKIFTALFLATNCQFSIVKFYLS
jgi:hypothetical protein